MVKVNAKPNENEAQLFRRFRGKVARAGILADVRDKRWYVPRSEQRRLKRQKAIRRARRAARTDTAE
jgi:small subunit ribosomal protein S21